MIRGRKRLQHDFQSHGSCSVPMSLALRNCSDSAVSVCVEAGPPSGAQPAGTVRNILSKCYEPLWLALAYLHVLAHQLR